MKKFFDLSKTLFFITLIFSCSNNLNRLNFDETEIDSNTKQKCLVTVNISHSNSLAKVAAIPDFTKLGIDKYVLTASAEGYDNQTQTISRSSTSANLLLEHNVEWTILVEGFNSLNKVVVKGQKKFTPSALENNLSITISPYQQTSKDGTPIPGSFSVNVNFPKEDCSITMTWYLDGTQIGNETFDCSQQDILKTLKVDEVEPGNHRITMNIVNSNVPDDMVIKIYDVVIYSNVESKQWLEAGVVKENISIPAEELVPLTLNDYAFYVLGDAAVNLTGTPEQVAQKVGKKRALKFATIQEAVNAIEGADPEGKYKSCLYLDGTIMTSAPAGASEIVKIGNGTNKPHIFIKGYNNSAAIFNMDFAATNTRIITIESNANVEVEGVTLMQGKISGNGGGIYCKGKLNFSGGITLCSAEYGGGLYCDGGEIDFKGEISSCTGTNTGGGIYIKNGTLKVHDFEIKQNSAYNSAGGAFINNDNACKIIFENGKFFQNEARRGTGGAITCAAQSGSNNGEYIYNASCKNVEFIENKALGTVNDYGQGGAIYVRVGRFISLIDCSTEGNVAEQIGYGTEKINGIFNNGTVYLGGSVKIEDGLYLNNAIRLASTLMPFEGNTVIGTIYPSTYTVGTEVLKAYSESLTSDLISYFALSNPNWEIDNTGKLKLLPFEDSEGTIIFENDTLKFYLSDTIVTTTSGTTNISLEIKNASGSRNYYTPAEISNVIENLDIKVFCGGTEVTSSNVSGFKIENCVITIPDTLPDDDYRIEISGIYKSNGQGISANLYFKVQR